jgi:hypothetical protein
MGEPIIGFRQMLGDNARVSKDRHVIGIPLPPGDDVEMEMIIDPCPCYLPYIGTDIKAVRGEDLLEEDDATLDAGHEVIHLFRLQILKESNVPLGSDHEVTVVVRIFV